MHPAEARRSGEYADGQARADGAGPFRAMPRMNAIAQGAAGERLRRAGLPA